MTAKTRILFVCTANAARSQMAEGLLRAKYGDRYEVFSAGILQAKVSTRAIAVMQEIGIDISHHRSKTLAEFGDAPLNLPSLFATMPIRSALSYPTQKRLSITDFPIPILHPARMRKSSKVIVMYGT